MSTNLDSGSLGIGPLTPEADAAFVKLSRIKPVYADIVEQRADKQSQTGVTDLGFTLAELAVACEHHNDSFFDALAESAHTKDFILTFMCQIGRGEDIRMQRIGLTVTAAIRHYVSELIQRDVDDKVDEMERAGRVDPRRDAQERFL